MNTLVRCLFICGLVLRAATTSASSSEDLIRRSRNVDSEAVARQVFDEDDKNRENETYKTIEDDDDEVLEETGRSIANGYEDEDSGDPHVAFKKRAKPLKNIFMGIYKNYKSTYLGNRTSLDYKKNLRDRIKASASKHGAWQNPKVEEDKQEEFEEAKQEEPEEAKEEEPEQAKEEEPKEEEPKEEELEEALVEDMDPPFPKESSDDSEDQEPEEEVTKPQGSREESGSQEESETVEESNEQLEKNDETETEAEDEEETSLAEEAIEFLQQQLAKKERKRKQTRSKSKSKKSRKRTKVNPPAGGDDPLVYADDHEFRYHVGPGLNMSLDMRNDIVNVKLDGDSLRELVTGRWLNENSEQGRGKKYEMVSKVLPLFIIPFLIQSAIVPFLVTKLKLLLMKSILVGKLAIFLLIISAIKNSNKMMQTYEVAPSYWAGEPSRRSEMAAAASAYNGYRVEGKPAAWIN